jgi:hypothetical protein
MFAAIERHSRDPLVPFGIFARSCWPRTGPPLA